MKDQVAPEVADGMTEQQRAATDQLQAEVSKWQNAAEEARPSLAPSWLEDENDFFF